MKKCVISLLMCLLLSMVLVGCSDAADKEQGSVETGKEDVNTNVTDEEMNLEELFQKGMDSYVGKDIEPPVLFPETDLEYLENFYPGISKVNMKQFCIAMAPVTNSPMEVALVEVEDSSDVATIRDIFQKRIDERANDTTYPEESGVWKKNGIVTVRGNYIFMAVMTDDYGIPEEFILD